jgi:hypothetical protein
MSPFPPVSTGPFAQEWRKIALAIAVLFSNNCLPSDGCVFQSIEQQLGILQRYVRRFAGDGTCGLSSPLDQRRFAHRQVLHLLETSESSAPMSAKDMARTITGPSQPSVSECRTARIAPTVAPMIAQRRIFMAHLFADGVGGDCVSAARVCFSIDSPIHEWDEWYR